MTDEAKRFLAKMIEPRTCPWCGEQMTDACCLPRALYVMSWTVPALSNPRLDEVERDGLRVALRAAWGTVRRADGPTLEGAYRQLGKQALAAREAVKQVREATMRRRKDG